MSNKGGYIGLMAAMLAMSSGDEFSIPKQRLFRVGPCEKGSAPHLKRKKVGNHFSYYVPDYKKNKAEDQV